MAGLLDSLVLVLNEATPQQHNDRSGPSYPLPVAGVGVRVEPQQGLLVHDCSDRLAGHSWVSFSPRQVFSSLLVSGKFLSSITRTEKHDTVMVHGSFSRILERLLPPVPQKLTDVCWHQKQPLNQGKKTT